MEIKNSGQDLTPLELRLYQISKKDGSNFSFQEIENIVRKSYIQPYLLKLIQNMHISLRKALRYFEHQLKIDEKCEWRHYYQESNVVYDWDNYLTDCQRLNMDLTKESVLLPKNLHQAHQNTIKQIKIKGNKLLDAKIKTLAKEIDKKYSFSKHGLTIRAAASSKELINEGKALNHCVGTYAEKYASGVLALLLIRKNTAPDEPYFTVEIKNNCIIQARGKYNCAPDKKVEKFLQAFTEAKLSTPKTTETKIKVPA